MPTSGAAERFPRRKQSPAVPGCLLSPITPAMGCDVAAGKTPMEAMRALKRRLSDVVYRQMVNDARTGITGREDTWRRLLAPARRLTPQCRPFGEVTSRTRCQ